MGGNLEEAEFADHLRALHSQCEQLRDEMTQHLNEEEQTVPGLLRRYNVAQQEEGAVIEQIVKSLGLSGNKIGLPWIIDAMRRWGGQQMVDEFMGNIPGPIRWLNNFSWTDHYLEFNKGAINRLTAV